LRDQYWGDLSLRAALLLSIKSDFEAE
jgi:hypothetical protein